MEKIFDTIIVGTGPAGLSAVLNLKKYNKDFVWFGSWNLSDKVRKAEMITNYPGLVGVTGEKLYKKFVEQVHANELTIEEKTVTNIMKNGDNFMVLADNQIYNAKSLILAVGVMSAKLIKGEDEYLGSGVSYCATCDGMLYKDKNIAVIANDTKYEHEVKYLGKLASKLYYFPMYKADEEIFDDDVIKRTDGYIKEIVGSKTTFGARVTGAKLSDDTMLEVDGVFILRNAIAPSKLMPELKTFDGHIEVDRNCATSVEGCYAAGDCTGRPYQYTKAVGEGNVAAHAVIEYLTNGADRYEN